MAWVLLFLPLLFLLPFVGLFLGTFPLAGVALWHQIIHPAWQKATHLAESGHHLELLHHVHVGHLLHERSHLTELL